MITNMNMILHQHMEHGRTLLIVEAVLQWLDSVMLLNY